MLPTRTNFSPLTQPVSLKDRQPFRRSNTFLLAAIIVIGIALLFMFLAQTLTRVDSLNSSQVLLAIVVYSVPIAVVPVAVYLYGMYEAGFRVRMKRFADANGLKFIYDVQSPLYDGMLFQVGHTRSIREAYVATKGDDSVEIGNYHYEIGHGRNRRLYNKGYVVMKLPRKLPHMVLDAKANNFLGKVSNLPEAFDKSQRLSLEGDFDQYFTLYAPKQYERDALYILTPDVMQLLVGEGRAYDVEIMGDQLYIYHAKRFALTKQDNLKQLSELITTFQKKFDMRVDYYADERVGDRALNAVAPEGATLKSRRVLPIFAVVFLIYLSLSSLDVVRRLIDLLRSVF